jgi:hypothetical protein
VVASRDFVGQQQTMRFQLADGETVDIDLATVHGLYKGGTPPALGDVLLYGSQPDLTWYVGVSGESDGRHRLISRQLNVDGGRMTLDAGLRLPIAAGVQPGAGPFEADALHIVFINERGEVIASH